MTPVVSGLLVLGAILAYGWYHVYVRQPQEQQDERIQELELPRFRGHLTIGGLGLLKGVHDGKNTAALSAGVPG